MAGLAQMFKELFSDFKKVRYYFIAMVLLFLFGGWLGASFTSFSDLLDQQLEGIMEMAESIDEKENQTLALFLFIFFNNAIKAVAIVFLGLLVLILPLFFVLINGMVLGYLFAIMHDTGINTVSMFVRGILPHGIIELPIILLASAYGVRLGMLLIRWIVARGERRQRNKDELFKVLKVSGALSLFIVITLFIAAGIEATITPILLSGTETVQLPS